MWDPEEVRLKEEEVYHNLKKKFSIHVSRIHAFFLPGC